MSTFVAYKNAKSKDEAYKTAVEQITPEYVAKFGVKAEIDFDEQSKKITATGKGFTLCLSFGETQCDVELDLNFMLKPFKGKIIEGIERKLERHI